MKWITPVDPGYDESRTLFNAMIDRRPAVIAPCSDAADVAEALKYARDHTLPSRSAPAVTRWPACH